MNCLLCLEGKVTGSRRKLNTSQENGDQGSSTTKRVHSTCLCFHGCYQLVCQPFSLKELNHTTFVAVLSSQMNCFLYGKNCNYFTRPMASALCTFCVFANDFYRPCSEASVSVGAEYTYLESECVVIDVTYIRTSWRALHFIRFNT